MKGEAAKSAELKPKSTELAGKSTELSTELRSRIAETGRKASKTAASQLVVDILKGAKTFLGSEYYWIR